MPDEQPKKGYVMPIITGIVVVVLTAVGTRTLSTYETVLKHDASIVSVQGRLETVGTKVDLALAKIQDHLQDEAKKEGRLDTMQHDMSQMNEGLKNVQTSMDQVKELLIQLKTREDMRSNENHPE